MYYLNRWNGSFTEEWRLDETQEKPKHNSTSVVLHRACRGTDHSPTAHDNRQEYARSHLVQDHVCRHLSQDISDKKDTDDGVVLCANQANILLEVAKSCGRNLHIVIISTFAPR